MRTGRRMHGMERSSVPKGTVEERGREAVRAALHANRRLRESGDLGYEWVLDVAWDRAVRVAHETGDAREALKRWVSAEGNLVGTVRGWVPAFVVYDEVSSW